MSSNVESAPIEPTNLDLARAAVQKLQAQIGDLQALGQRANPCGASLQGQFLAAQQQFQGQILPLGDRDSPHWPPILTEMNRTLRLVAMDVAFLQAARQPITVQQRQRQLLDKLQQLAGFCEALLAAL